MGKIKKFEDLIVWQKAHNLVLEVYKITRDFPSEEKFGLVSQMRRSAISIVANICEGFKKRSVKDKLNFYNIAEASLDELRYYVKLSNDLKYINVVDSLENKIEEVGRMLSGLASSIKNRLSPSP